MADERSPLLQNGQEHGGQTDYLAVVNEHEQADSAVIGENTSGNGSADAEQQTVVAPHSSVIALVRDLLANVRMDIVYLF
jgi:hypothetical protein